MRIIILSFILLLCSCCPVDSSNNSIEKKDKIVVKCSNEYKVKQDYYGVVVILREFELNGHIFLANTLNNRSIIHAPWCPCKQKLDETTSDCNESSVNFENSIFSNSYF